MEPQKIPKVMDASYEDFVKTYLPLYSGPQVKVQIGSQGHEYTLSKAILSRHSQNFAKMFDGAFKEGKEDIAKLDELDGVVSVRSFEMLIQWMYIRRVIGEATTPGEQIEAMTEFARLADFCQVEGLGELAAERIKAVILANPAPKDGKFVGSRHPDTNTYSTTSRAISWASFLPKDHAVRKMLAMAVVEGYLRCTKHKFLKETQEIPSFGMDVLNAVKPALNTLRGNEYRNTEFTDPISGMTLRTGC